MEEEKEREEARLLITSSLLENGDQSFSDATTVLLLATFVAVSGSFGFGCACGYSSPAESGIMNDLGLNTAEYSLFVSIMSIGGMLGSVICGKVTDKMGRKKALLFSEIFCLTGWFAIFSAEGVWWLNFGRFSMGFGFGILLYVVNVYVAEITPKNIRGGFTATNQVSICFGVSLMFFFGNVVSWRSLAMFGMFPCIIQFLGVFFIPESPRWLAKVGREEEMETSLQRLRGKKADVTLEAAEIRVYTKAFEELSEGCFFDLFEPRYAHALIVGLGIIILVPFGGNSGILSYASSIFETAGCSAIVGTTILAIIQVPFTLLSAVLMDRSGRRTLLMVCSGGTCLGTILIALGFLLKTLSAAKELSAIMVLSGVLYNMGSYFRGIHFAQATIVLDYIFAMFYIFLIFPTSIRGSAGSLMSLLSFLSSMIVSYTFNYFFEWSPAAFEKNPVYDTVLRNSLITTPTKQKQLLQELVIRVVNNGITVLFVIKLVPETKGLSLEEIHASMTRHTASKNQLLT